MTTATSDDLTTLRERRRQLSDRLEDIRQDQRGIAEDLASARQDWWHCVEIGEDAELLAERVHLHERGLSDRGHAAAHLETLLADLDTKIADVTAKAQLADDVQSYHAAVTAYAETLVGLPTAPTDAVEVIDSVLTELLAEIDTARTSHDQLVATAGTLRMRGEQIGAEVELPQPPGWSDGLEREHHGDTVTRALMLSLIQRRGEQAVLSEIARAILLGINAQRRATR